MTLRYLIIVLVVVLAAAALFFRQGTDKPILPSRGPANHITNPMQAPHAELFSTPEIFSENTASVNSIEPNSKSRSDDSSKTANANLSNIAFTTVWGDLIAELGLSTERALKIAQIVSQPGTDPDMLLREELGEAGYQAYLDYLPSVPVRNELIPFKLGLAVKGMPSLDRETDNMLLQIVREENHLMKPGKGYSNYETQKQLHERIYKRASGILSAEALALFKSQQVN